MVTLACGIASGAASYVGVLLPLLRVRARLRAVR